MKPLTIILAEAGLELVPKEIQNHPAVVKNARKRGKKPSEVLLDISLHYKAMRRLDRWYKRGRPDIVHTSLLNAISSPLNMAGLLRIYVHTVNNVVIHIDPTTRVPRNYNRFVGLIEQVLTIGRAPPDSDKPLIWIENKNLSEFIREKKPAKVVIMHEQGTKLPLKILGEVFAKYMAEDKDLYVIIGAFQHGDFEKETLSLADELISIFSKPLDTWVVVSRIIEGIENALGIC